MDRISPNTLFHFTRSFKNLLGILTNEFYPRYSLELATILASPMVCFCDILLSQIKNHIKTYGYYGIGMSKEWGTKSRLNPVLYFQGGSNLSREIGTLLTDVMEIKPNHSGIRSEVLRYLKPYEGDLYRDTGIIKNIRFYDEREWRYVPSIEKCRRCGIEGFLWGKGFQDSTKRDEENAKIQKAKLSFEPTDIKYIIVEEEGEILPMVKALENIKGPKYNFDIVRILTTKIITSKQIKEDF